MLLMPRTQSDWRDGSVPSGTELKIKFKDYLSDAFDPVADAEIYDDPTNNICPEHRPDYTANLMDAWRHV